jgi:hypothetical protein
MPGATSVNATVTATIGWQVQLAQPGGLLQPTVEATTLQTQYVFGTQKANTTTLGADEVFSFQVSIASGGQATVDLYSMGDLLGQIGVVVARLKSFLFRLLSATNNPNIVPAPDPGTTVAITNNLASMPAQLDFGNGGTGLTLVLTVGAGAVTGVAIGVAGSGYSPSSTFLVAPCQQYGSGCVVAITTNASGVPTTATLLAGGKAYSGATVPSVVIGQFLLQMGGVHMCLDADPQGTGYCPITPVSRQILIVNNDPLNAATVEIDLVAATT